MTRLSRTIERAASWLAAASIAVASVAATAVVAVALAGSLGACDKPKASDCKQAVANIRRLYGTHGADFGVDPKAMIRSCRGSASRESVRCFIEAKSLTDLDQCEGGSFGDMFPDEGQSGAQSADKPDDKPDDKPGAESDDKPGGDG